MYGDTRALINVRESFVASGTVRGAEASPPRPVALIPGASQPHGVLPSKPAHPKKKLLSRSPCPRAQTYTYSLDQAFLQN